VGKYGMFVFCSALACEEATRL